MRLTQVDSQNPDFISAVTLLDTDLAKRDGTKHAFYAQFNQTQQLKHRVVAQEIRWSFPVVSSSRSTIKVPKSNGGSPA